MKSNVSKKKVAILVSVVAVIAAFVAYLSVYSVRLDRGAAESTASEVELIDTTLTEPADTLFVE